MNKVYIVVPFLCLAVFAGFFMKFEKGYDARLLAAKQREVAAKQEKAKKEIVDREKAYALAIEAQAKRKLEREAKEKIDQQKKDDRQIAEDKRIKANDDKNRLTTQVRSLKKDLEEVQAEVKKIEEQKKTYVDEQTFLKTYVKQAETNVKYYYDLLDKIALAEKARADAAAAAAATAKKNS